jgi:hypothetical protein
VQNTIPTSPSYISKWTNAKKIKQKKDVEQMMETSGLINYDGININQHEHMINTLHNLSNHQYLSFNHWSKMMNEYNNPTLLSCMFSNLFPFGISILDMPNRPIKVSLQMHTKHLMNLNDTQYNFSKHHLFSFFGFNITQQRQICLKAKLTMSRSSNMNENK